MSDGLKFLNLGQWKNLKEFNLNTNPIVLGATYHLVLSEYKKLKKINLSCEISR